MKRFVHLPADEISLPGILYALGNPARLQIACNLYASRTPLTCVQSIVGIEDLPVATRSNCFRVLRECGIIRSEKKGRECYNSLRLAEVEKLFPKVMATILRNATR